MELIDPDKFRTALRLRSLSYAQVATSAGCHRSFIGALVTGRKKSCTPEMAERIARAVGVPVRLLFRDMPKRQVGRPRKGNAA